jgi:hypothetical protein
MQDNDKSRKPRKRDLEKARISNKRDYEKNGAKYQARVGRRNAQLKMAALEAHRNLRNGIHTCWCQRCKSTVHPAALEFHHRDPESKLFNISSAVVRPRQYSWDMILAEIAKCDVICSNRHRTEHSTRSYEGLWDEAA